MKHAAIAVALAVAFAAGSAHAAHAWSRMIAPLVTGDEPIVITEHTMQTAHGPLQYEARVGRLPIRVDETGEVHAHVFFVAYVVKQKAGSAPRPLMIAWNGGPTIPSIYVHTEFLGPRRITKDGVVDNLLTLLTTSDLVFYDPVETGFSRLAQPQFAPEFFNMKGDVAAASEFVRAYRARFGAQTQPLFLLGESYGVWRAAAVAEFLAKRGLNVTGLLLISGGFPSVKMPVSFWNAMNVQNHAATALHYRRLSPDLQRVPVITMRQVDAWVAAAYLPALDKADTLSDAERKNIIEQLAAYTGVRPDQIDAKTLVMNTRQFLTGFFDGDRARELAEVDTRRFGDEKQPPERQFHISRYLREELGYATDLGYTGALGFNTDLAYRALEAGYMPTPGAERRSSGKQWSYNQTDGAAAALAMGRVDGEVWHMFNENPSWVQNAMQLQPGLQILVAVGRYDPTNSCEGQARSIATLPDDLTRRITVKCYEGGHMMYRDEAEHKKLAQDLERFMADGVTRNHTAPIR
ncbi:MAG: Serine carboxypeptidase [Rhodospirillales bacterium]|jgi:carboxypeptidase C (cathepsin A)|nr:Serine carboxypeptidase [Rhodospirillales bacterium]